jgi:hypothetical protein
MLCVLACGWMSWQLASFMHLSRSSTLNPAAADPHNNIINSHRQAYWPKGAPLSGAIHPASSSVLSCHVSMLCSAAHGRGRPARLHVMCTATHPG